MHGLCHVHHGHGLFIQQPEGYLDLLVAEVADSGVVDLAEDSRSGNGLAGRLKVRQ